MCKIISCMLKASWQTCVFAQYDFPPEVLAIIRKDGRRSHAGQRQKWCAALGF